MEMQKLLQKFIHGYASYDVSMVKSSTDGMLFWTPKNVELIMDIEIPLLITIVCYTTQKALSSFNIVEVKCDAQQVLFEW